MNTSHDDHPDPTVNPLVSEMLAAGKDQTTSIEGFVGKVEAGMVRIYANLGLNHYIEVPGPLSSAWWKRAIRRSRPC